MIISYGSLRLETIKEHHIEIIRKWRNSKSIKKTMLFQDTISTKQQSAWFKVVTEENQLFFLCYEKNEAIGIIYANKIDWLSKISYNSGIFLVKKEIYGTGIPIQLGILFTQCGFAFGIKENRIIVRNDNRNAINFNESMGYQCVEQFEDYGIYTVDKSSFDSKLQNIPTSLKTNSPVTLIWENLPSDLFLQNLFKNDFSSLAPFFEIKIRE